MIRQHDFNTAWFGAPAGVVGDAAFFALPPERRAELLRPFAWAEFSADAPDAGLRIALAAAGFIFADQQINFRIALPERTVSACPVDIRFADEERFALAAEDMPHFEHERFRLLPGMTAARLDERYRRWGTALIEEAPATCLCLRSAGRAQGWFLSRPVAGRGLNLTLAMRHPDASLSGLVLYEESLAAYRRRGHRVGWASFSASNTAVHTIYARLGARFLHPTERYLWVADPAGRNPSACPPPLPYNRSR